MGDILRAIVEGREWSWSVVGLFILVVGLAIRSALIGDVLRGLKIRNRNWYKRTQVHYQERAVFGWMFFAFCVVGAMLLWRFETFFLQYLNLLQWGLILLVSFVLSLFCHLRAYARAIVEAVEEHVADDKDI